MRLLVLPATTHESGSITNNCYINFQEHIFYFKRKGYLMKQVVFQNKKIFYRTAGSGNPVMLLHGFAEDHRIWDYQVENLKNDFLVILPDIPGSGASEMLRGNISIADYAEVIKSIADAEGITSGKKSFTLIGHSMGGYITLAFAEKYPDLLNGFGLFHSSAFADDEIKIAARKKGIDFIKTKGAEWFLRTTIPNLFAEKTKLEKPDLIEKLITLSKNIPPEALEQYYEAMMQRPDRITVPKSFPKPVLYIVGKLDNAVPLNLSLKQCHFSPIFQINILQNSGHVGMWEEKDLSIQCINSFLAKTINYCND